MVFFVFSSSFFGFFSKKKERTEKTTSLSPFRILCLSLSGTPLRQARQRLAAIKLLGRVPCPVESGVLRQHRAPVSCFCFSLFLTFLPFIFFVRLFFLFSLSPSPRFRFSPLTHPSSPRLFLIASSPGPSTRSRTGAASPSCLVRELTFFDGGGGWRG